MLIVEGHSDLLFYAAFLHHLGQLEGVYIQIFDGKSNILKRETLALFLNEKRLAEKRSIGLLLDADDNPAGTIQSVQAQLKAITGRDITEGKWHAGEPSLGFFVAPSGDSRGEIETLAWNSVARDPELAEASAAVETYLGKMTELGRGPHSPDKARIGAYLASVYDDDPRLGAGAREKKFDFDSSVFDRLRAFLEGIRQDVS